MLNVFTAAQHQEAMESAKAKATRWDVATLREWARQRVELQMANIEEFAADSREHDRSVHQFCDNFFNPVFLKEFNRLNPLQQEEGVHE